MKNRGGNPIFKFLVIFICIILSVLSLMPFIIMIVNSTRSTYEIQQNAVSLIPSKYFLQNLKILTGKSFNPLRGFFNSILVSTCTTVLALYFSTLTAYAIVMYEWKFKKIFFSFIMAVMMIPSLVFFTIFLPFPSAHG